MICKFNDKGSKLPYKLISWIPVSDIESASHNIPSKSKSSIKNYFFFFFDFSNSFFFFFEFLGVTIKLATDELSFHTKQIEEAKSWEKGFSFLFFFKKKN